MRRRRAAVHVLMAWVVIGSVCGVAPAAESDLAKVLPGPSVLYLGWHGAASAGPAFDATALGELLAEPELKSLCDTISPQLTETLTSVLTQEGVGELSEPIKQLAGLLWKHPGAANLMKLSLSTKGPLIEAVIAWHLGEEIETFTKLFDQITAPMLAMPPVEVPVGDVTLKGMSMGAPIPDFAWGRVGEYYVVIFGKGALNKVVTSLQGTSDRPPLIQDDDFAATRSGLAVKDGTLALDGYLSISQILLRLPLVGVIVDIQQRQATGQKPDRQPLSILFRKAIDALELKKIKSVGGAVSMHGKDFRLAWFLNAPDAKGGLMRFFHQPPVSESDLGVVPQDAIGFYTANFDFHGFYQGMMSALKEVDPNMHQAWVDMIAEGERVVDVKLIDDVLAPLDDGWTLYAAPSAGSLLDTGLALVIETKDAAHAEKTVTALAQSIVEHIGGAEAKITEAKTSGGKGYRFVEADMPEPVSKLSPAWGVAGKYLVIGWDKQTTSAAIDRLSSGDLAATSVAKREDFATRRRLIPEGSNGIGYLDAKYVLGGLYRMLLPELEKQLPGLAELGLKLDASKLPSPETLEKHLHGMVMGITADAKGVLMASYAPLPLPTPSSQTLALAGGVLAARYVTQTQAEEAEFAELVMIAKACHVYAARHDGAFPPSLDTLVDRELLKLGKPVLGKYAYVSGLTATAPPTCVLAYDKTASEAGKKRVRVLRVPGRCEWLGPDELKAALEATAKHAKPAATKEAGSSQ